LADLAGPRAVPAVTGFAARPDQPAARPATWAIWPLIAMIWVA